MAPVAWELLLFLSVCYVSLITCWSADVDAVGAWLTLCRPRGVIRITREVIDKAGLNRLLDPHQSLFLSPINHHSSPQLLCLVPPTPTPSPSIPSVTVLGSLPQPRRGTISNSLSRRGVLGCPLIHPLWMSIRGPNIVWRMPTRSRIYNWQTLLMPTKGGCHAGYPFGVI
jgi:hypothetical protein